MIAATPGDYQELLPRLGPGDTLRLGPGDYHGGLALHGIRGEPGHPIVIEGPAQGRPARFLARPGAHTVSLVDAAWVEVRNIELDGRGLPVNAVRCEGTAGFAHHVVLANLYVHGHGASQGIAAIASFCAAWNWIIRDNVIVDAGTGMYLGQADGSAPFVAGVIEHNLVLDSTGYNLQIKHQRQRPSLAGMPDRPAVTVIRHNVFSKARRASGGEWARPSVLVGHWPLSGAGADDRYEIYGNVFWQNPGEALFQGEGNLVLYNNLFVNRHGDAVRIMPHNDIPRAVSVFHNTVLAADTGILLDPGPGAFPQHVFANAVFAAVPLAGAVSAGSNFAAAWGDAPLWLAAPFAEPGELDLYPWRTMPQPPSGTPPVGAFSEAERDFNGQPRLLAMPGAYAGKGVNPGWRFRLERKPRPPADDNGRAGRRGP